MGIHVSMYSLFMFLGIAAFFATYYVIVERKEKVDRFHSNRFLFISVLGVCVLGISAFIFNSIFHSIEQKKLVIGGITWLGGVVGLVPFLVFCVHKFLPKAKGSAMEWVSLLIPGIVLGHAFGRFGCFFAGCCYGKVTDSIFGISFPEGSHAALQYPGPDGRSLPVLPTQLFEACFELTLFIVMVSLYRWLKKYNTETYLISYGVFRFILEFFRGDDRGSTGFFLSPAQFICVIVIVLAVLSVLMRQKIICKKLNAKLDAWREEAAQFVVKPKPKDGEKPVTDALKDLFELKETGAITEEEYAQKKEELLKRL